ncbi:MAG: hypothetical protein K0S45_4245 [Nitrospira sp.]|nr:hypothetical protein [Nitrospira sp.]
MGSGFAVIKNWRSGVSDDFPFDHSHNQPGYIGGMVRNSFQVFADECEANSPSDRLRIFNHEGHQLPEQLMRPPNQKLTIK